MEIKKLSGVEYDSWNEFALSSYQYSIFTQTWYLDALNVNYEILVVLDKSKIKCGIILPLNEVKTFSNPMFCKYLGVLYEESKGNLQKEVSKRYKYQALLIKELKRIKSFDYYFHPNYSNWIPFYWEGFSQQTRYTYRINLSGSSIENLYKLFHGNLRNDIVNAQKKGVSIDQDIGFDNLYNLVNKTFLRQGSKAPFSKERLQYFLETLTIRGCVKTFVAIDGNNDYIASCCLVFDENSAYFILNGIDSYKQIRGANALMIFESIKWCHSRFKYFDFEGSMLPGVEQFYRRFGGELTEYYRIFNDTLFNFAKTKAKKIYKNLRYGR
jgi:lipid II:glycine glycyltransferase (peptidoglycan interpeptide bridge formation enzyme)